MSRKPIIVGNWKMHKTIAEAVQLVDAICEVIDGVSDLEVGVAPPFSALAAVRAHIDQRGKTQLILSAQNCHQEVKGAYTGEVSLPMLVDIGCSHIIVGHSERRQYFAEDDALINQKVNAVLSQDLTPILCIGEQLAEREAGQTFTVVERQLRGALAGVSSEQCAKTVVAYEPVWAIGTGRTATPEQAQEVHAFLREQLAALYTADTAANVRIQYGGSVKPDNIDGLMALPDVDGALVGGASLDPKNFIPLLKYTRD